MSTPPAGPALHNPPGRPSLSYRLGTHRAFLRQMLERLPRQSIPDGPHGGARPLAALATHSDRDPTVALLDAFAAVADVLTFYQERIANEGFLRTAADPRSVMELARALGYQLSPGLAAGTWLAFTVEEAAGAPGRVSIAPGLRALSLPGQGEQPQPFETTEGITARPEWNVLRPATTAPQALQLGSAELWLKGYQLGLSPGDFLLIVGQERETRAGSDAWELRTIRAVAPDPAAGRTRIALMPQGQARPLPGGGKVYAMRHRAAAFGHNAPDWLAAPQEVRSRYAAAHGVAEGDTWPGFRLSLEGGRLHLDNVYGRILPGTWMSLAAGGQASLYWVEDVPTVSHGRFTLAARCSAPVLTPHPGAGQGAALAPELTGSPAARREVLVLGQGEELQVADRPLVDDAWGASLLAPVGGTDALDLDRVVPGLADGRTLIVTGKRPRARVVAQDGITLIGRDGARASYAKDEVLFVAAPPAKRPSGHAAWRLADAAGFEGRAELPDGTLALEPARADDAAVAEVATIRGVTQLPGRTRLSFTEPLQSWLDGPTVAIHGNIALATHGETVREVLGSGNGGTSNQRFTLARSPVTWVSAATPTGRRSTLEVRVNGVQWREVTSWHDQGPHSRVYLVQRDDQGRIAVLFGDGVHGARLPTGQENVVASYRTGAGPEGAVPAGKIAFLQTRPLGLRAVTNPLAATGAEGPDGGEAARREAPASVLTLDRLVAVTDYGDFAQSFAGIGKAQAVLMRRGARQRVHVTLALADGTPAPSGADVVRRLAAAMDGVRDRTLELELAGFEPRWFRMAATLRIAPDHAFADVAAAARQALAAAYSFERRAYGQGISAAEVIALLQGIPGVAFVDLDGLAFGVPGQGGAPTSVAPWLNAEGTRWGSDDARSQEYQLIQPAQLLRVDPSPQGITLGHREEEP